MQTEKAERTRHSTRRKRFPTAVAVVAILILAAVLIGSFFIFRAIAGADSTERSVPIETPLPTVSPTATEIPGTEPPAPVQEEPVDLRSMLSMQNISAGTCHSVALRSDGTVVAVGDNTSGQCDVSAWRDIVAVETGFDFTLAIMQDGYVVAAGNNVFGQFTKEWEYLKAVSANLNHIVGLRNDGTVLALGNNDKGQCNTSAWTDIVDISAGFNHTVGLKSDGSLVAIGDNSEGQCNVEGWTDIIAIAAGHYHTVGLRADGKVLACGYNEYHQTDVQDWSDIIAIDAALAHTVGLKSDGTAVATGYNKTSQCNVESWEDLVAISAGDAHTLGLKSDGTVLSIGSNSHQQGEVSTWSNIKQGSTQPDFSGSTLASHVSTASENFSCAFDNVSRTLTISGNGPIPDYTAESALDAPWAAFSNVSSIVIEEGITAIGDWSFFYLVNFMPDQGVKSISLPSSLDRIGEAAFEFFFDLKDVYYNGTEAQWNLITVEKGNGSIFSANMHYTDSATSQTATIADAEFSYNYDESTATLTVSGQGVMPNYNNETPWADYKKSTRVLIIEEGISRISESAFSAFADIYSVEGGFRADEGLTTVVLPSSLTRIDQSAFILSTFIEDVYYTGTQEQWQNISIGIGNEDLISATIHFGETYPQ